MSIEVPICLIYSNFCIIQTFLHKIRSSDVTEFVQENPVYSQNPI